MPNALSDVSDVKGVARKHTTTVAAGWEMFYLTASACSLELSVSLYCFWARGADSQYMVEGFKVERYEHSIHSVANTLLT